MRQAQIGSQTTGMTASLLPAAILWLGLMGLALALAAYSVYLSWEAANLWFGTTKADFDRRALGVVGVDIAKTLMIGVIVALWSLRQRAIAIVLAVVLVGATLASVQATYSIFTTGRITALGERQVARVRVEELKTKRATLRTVAANVSQYRPLDVMVEEIKRFRVDRRWTSTAGCTDATAQSSRAFCDTYYAALAELAGANRASEVQKQIDRLDARIAKQTTVEVIAYAAPSLAALSRLTGWSVQGIIELRAIALAVLIEVLSIVLISAAWMLRPWHRSERSAGPSAVLDNEPNEKVGNNSSDLVQRRPASKARKRVAARSKPARINHLAPEHSDDDKIITFKARKTRPGAGQTERSGGMNKPAVNRAVGVMSTGAATGSASLQAAELTAMQSEPLNLQSSTPSVMAAAFMAECVQKVRGRRTSAGDVWTAYQAWSNRQGAAPMTRQAFGRQLRNLGLEKSRSGKNGTYVYSNMAVRT